MSKTARLLAVVGAVVIIVGAFVALRPDDENDGDTSARTSQTTASDAPFSTAADESSATSTTQTQTTPARPRPPLLTAATVRRIEVKRGDTVRFDARSSTDEEIHVHGYDLSKEAPAGKRVRMSFKASLEGIYEIEFEHSGTPIAELRVEPR